MVSLKRSYIIVVIWSHTSKFVYGMGWPGSWVGFRLFFGRLFFCPHCSSHYSHLSRTLLSISQPGPAYDLLIRFLTSQSFIDVELPQVRSSQPVEPKSLEWMHLYPTGESAYRNSFGSNHHLGSTEATTSTTISANLGATLGGGGSSSSSIEGQQSLWTTPSSHGGSLLMAFMAGLIIAVVGIKIFFTGNNHDRRRRGGYSPVPDSTTTSSSS